MTEKDYSLDALNKFLNYAANKGLLKKNTALSRNQAANKIFSVLEPKELEDLRTVDVKHAFERFANLQGTDFKPSSLQIYRSRLNTALSDFFSYVENPASFKPTGAQRSPTRAKKNDNGKPDVKQANAQAISETTTHEDENLHQIKHIVGRSR